jgi:hypothetical protein
MRFMSNGIFSGTLSRGSFITLALTLSRCARDLNTTQENTAVSPRFSFRVRENGMPHFAARSSPTHSRYSSAPWSRHTLAPSVAMRL